MFVHLIRTIIRGLLLCICTSRQYLAFWLVMASINKCIDCSKFFSRNQNKQLKCSECSYFLHLSCALISKQQYKNYSNENKDFICQYCEDYTCLACNKHVYDWQEGVLCDCCEQWIDRKCARLAKQKYKETDAKEEEVWYCKTCTKYIFPFHEINNTQLDKILNKSGRPKNDINGNHRVKLCFIQFNTIMAGWLLLTVLICLHNQLSYIIYSITRIKSTDIWKMWFIK